MNSEIKPSTTNIGGNEKHANDFSQASDEAFASLSPAADWDAEVSDAWAVDSLDNLSFAINQSPVGYAAGDANLYRYVGNQPTSATDPTGLSKVKVIIKIGDNIVKVLRLTKEEVRGLLKARTKDALNPKDSRKYGGKVFVDTYDDKTAKELAEGASPLGEAKYHGPTGGYPGHHHPVKRRTGGGKQDTEGTPHIGPDYSGVAVPFGLAGMMESGADIVVDLTPFGDIRDIATGAPEIYGAICETRDILAKEGIRGWEIRSRQRVNLMEEQSRIRRTLPGGEGPLRAGGRPGISDTPRNSPRGR